MNPARSADAEAATDPRQGRAAARWSLRSRLYAVAAAAVLLAWVGGGGAMYLAARQASERMCQENLVNLAQTILSFSEHELEEMRAQRNGAVAAGNVHDDGGATLASRYSYQIWSDAGELLLRSGNAPASQRLAEAGHGGFSQTLVEGRPHEVFALHSPSRRMTIVVADAEDDAVLGAVFGGSFGLVMLALLPLVLGGTWLLLRQALAPLLQTGTQLEQRGPQARQALAPLAVDNAPRELEPVIGAVNRLMRRVDDALSQERAFTALAAHEMRTPLASLRLQAQVLSRATERGERERELRALTRNVDRCTRLLNQLLALARLDAAAPGALTTEPLALAEMVAQVLPDLADEAARRGVELQCDLLEPQIRAERVGLAALLRNLLANALRHAPEGGVVRVRSVREGDRLRLDVEDSGPGIPAEDRQRVFERFYRRPGSEGLGVGLGLAIVASVARLHGAVVTLGDSDLGGLRASVSFARG